MEDIQDLKLSEIKSKLDEVMKKINGIEDRINKTKEAPKEPPKIPVRESPREEPKATEKTTDTSELKDRLLNLLVAIEDLISYVKDTNPGLSLPLTILSFVLSMISSNIDTIINMLPAALCNMEKDIQKKESTTQSLCSLAGLLSRIFP